jgi:hypothetical protein
VGFPFKLGYTVIAVVGVICDNVVLLAVEGLLN